MDSRRKTAVAAFLIALGATALIAQSISGSIVGTVRDPAGLPMAGARITLIHAATGVTRETATNERGDFVLSSVPPGEYSLAAKAEGFKTAERKGIMLTASETRSLGEIAMELGSVADSVTVRAEGTAVQTASSERAGLVTSSQIEGIQVKGRNVFTMLSLMPGVSTPRDPDVPSRIVQVNINGGRDNTVSTSVDGMGINQRGAMNALLTVSQDAVAEVKVLLISYPAEYGRYSGANMQIVTKSGTREFHGRASYYKRHEQFNANNFFNNRLGTKKPIYRYNDWNYSLGGPVYIPDKWNRDRNKLFFFWSQEFWPVKTTGAIRQVTVPTELERVGNFSQTQDLNGRLIPIKDPDSGLNFPGNIIPASRVDRSGAGLLNSFPKPNFFDRTISAGRYNYVEQAGQTQPLRFTTLKLDFNGSPKHQFSYSQNSQIQKASGYGTSGTGSTNWNFLSKTFSWKPIQSVLRYTGLYSATMVNELTVGGMGAQERDEDVPEDSLKANQRQTWGFVAGQFSPSANPLGILPNVTFGGVSQAANRNLDPRFLMYRASNLGFSVSDNLTKTFGAHTLKAGILAERLIATGTITDQYFGRYDFTPDANNPLETGHAYANAALGVFKSYTEATSKPWNSSWNTNVEWFVQDTWKVNRRLTLDYGLRFYRLGYVNYRSGMISGFVPGRYDPAKAVRLIRPATVGGKRVGQDPVTGAVFPLTAAGAIAPNSGDPTNGMVVPAFDPSYPVSLVDQPGVQLAPRFGFAWDPFGRGRTSLRGGFGVFYNRQDNQGMPVPQTPVIQDPVVYYGTLSNLLSSSTYLFPGSVSGWDRNQRTARVMNVHVSLQQNIGFGTVVEAAYVGSLGRNLVWNRLLDPIPMGANFNPANANPTNPRSALPPAFLRAYQGFDGVSYIENAASSNYHALQAGANRRFAKTLEFGVSWTWSKALNYNDGNNDSVSSVVPVRVWNYGLASYDRTHLLKANWLWTLPSAPFQNVMVRRVLNGWQVSGIASFLSGAPALVSYTFVSAVDVTGSPDQAARIVVTGNPVLPRSRRSFERNFRTDVFRGPQVGTIGNAARSILRGPGVNNWDISLIKNVPLHETLRLQFRLEMYNAFNHTQFSAWDMAARFDAAGAQTNSRLGQSTAARLPRQMQMSLRLLF